MLHKTVALVKTGLISWIKYLPGFPSDVLQLLDLNSVIHAGS